MNILKLYRRRKLVDKIRRDGRTIAWIRKLPPGWENHLKVVHTPMPPYLGDLVLVAYAKKWNLTSLEARKKWFFLPWRRLP